MERCALVHRDWNEDSSSETVDVGASELALRRLLALLPRLRAVVLVGRAAETAIATIQDACPRARVFVSPHPSPLFVNRKPGNRDCLLVGVEGSSGVSKRTYSWRMNQALRPTALGRRAAGSSITLVGVC